ncbi:hypothetical protein N9L08_09885, partial [Rhodobacteraceae bacterium]|nr:hypothetical protein [Paracoccaceae bacterium]
SWKDPYWGGEGTNYNDADWNYLGDVFSDGTFKTVRTETKNSDGTRTEVGTEYTNAGTTDSPVWEEARSWNFKFDDNWNLVEGTETREDGVTVQFGANWIIKGETFDTSKLAGNELDPTTKIVSKDDYALLDASKELTYADLFDFTTTVNGQEVTTAYAMTEEFTWGGSETVYYNASGDIVGRSHANDMFLRQEDTLPKFKFFRMETKEEGGYIDFFGVGVDHLDAFSGKAIMIPLGAKVGGRVDNPADIPTTVAALDAMIDDFSQSQISSDAAYGPEKPNWLATRNGADTVDGVVSLSTLGFVVSNISAEAPTIESIVDIDVISGDDLQYYYSWENDDAIFSNVNDTTEVTVDTAKIIETYSTYLTANPPQNIQFMGPEHEFIASVDKSFDQLHYRFEKDDPNSDGIVETGVDVNPYSVRSWEFDLDENFNFLGGTETEDGITREINQFGQTTSQTIDASALDKLTTQATLDDLPSSFVLKDENDAEYANYKSEKYPGGVETFYFTDSGTILGRSTSWSDPYWGGSGIDYFDASDQFIGGTFSDGTYTSVRFETTDASTGNLTETGSETRDGTVEREWTFEFDSNFNLISGTETRSDGTTTTYGANWEILGESVSLSSLTALTANDFNAEIVKFDASAADVASGLVKLSDVYDFSVTGSSTLSGYYKKDDFDWSDGYEITYYDGAGKTLGRKIVDIFVDQGGISGQVGGVTANQGGSSGSSSTTFVVTQVDGKFLIDGVSQKELTLNEGKTYKFDLSSTTLSTHPFMLGAGGSEYTHGTDGSTIVPNGTQATSGAYLEVTLSPSAPSALNYYCSAHSGMGAAISTNDAQINVQYVDKDWNWIGDSFDDGNFSRSFIKVSKDDGSKVEISVDGNRSSLYNFNDEDVFQGGTEIEGGLTYTITSDWVREGGKMDTSALNALKVTDSALDDLPASFIIDPDPNTANDEFAYREKTFEDTNNGGKEYTYFDSTGAKLGHSFEFTDSWSGEKVTDFNDKDYNWLGNVRVKTGEYKNVYSRSEDQTAGTSTEVNARYTWDAGNTSWVESESSTYIFNLNNGNLIEGTETRGGITTEYGANWAVEKSSANLSPDMEISAVDLAEHLGNSNVALEDLYNFTATVNGSEVTKGYKLEQSFSDPYSGGGTNVDTTYYNAAGEEIGKSNSYSGSYGSGANFQDADYNHLGDYNEQGTWSNSFFKIPTTDEGGNVTGKTEYRVEKDTGSNGFTREFVEVFDANGNFVSGTETENGLTKDITVDANGFRVVSAAALPESELAALAVTDATVLAEIPTSFVFDVSGTDTAYVKLTRDDSAGGQMTGGGKEYTYFNAQGTEIGRAFEFQNYDGAKVTDFNTTDHQFLGSVRVKTDDYKEIRFEETKDVSGTQRFVETFTEYTWDTSASPAAWK